MDRRSQLQATSLSIKTEPEDGLEGYCADCPDAQCHSPGKQQRGSTDEQLELSRVSGSSSAASGSGFSRSQHFNPDQDAILRLECLSGRRLKVRCPCGEQVSCSPTGIWVTQQALCCNWHHRAFCCSHLSATKLQTAAWSSFCTARLQGITFLPVALLGTPLHSVRPQLGGRRQHRSHMCLKQHGDGMALKLCMGPAGHDLVQEPHEAGVRHLHCSHMLIGGHGGSTHGCCLQVSLALCPSSIGVAADSLACSKAQSHTSDPGVGCGAGAFCMPLLSAEATLPVSSAVTAQAPLPDQCWSSNCAEKTPKATPGRAGGLRRCCGVVHGAADGGPGAVCPQLPEGQPQAEVLVQAPPEMHSPDRRVHDLGGGLEPMFPCMSCGHCGLPRPAVWQSVTGALALQTGGLHVAAPGHFGHTCQRVNFGVDVVLVPEGVFGRLGAHFD